MNLITHQHSGAYHIQVQPVQQKGLRHTLHLSTNLTQWEIKSARNFTTSKQNKDKVQRKKSPHSLKRYDL